MVYILKASHAVIFRLLAIFKHIIYNIINTFPSKHLFKQL